MNLSLPMVYYLGSRRDFNFSRASQYFEHYRILRTQGLFDQRSFSKFVVAFDIRIFENVSELTMSSTSSIMAPLVLNKRFMLKK